MADALRYEPGWSDEGLAIAEHARVAVMIWRGVPTRARIERSRDAFLDISTRLGDEKLSLLAVIEEGSPPPELEHFPVVVRGFDAIAERLSSAVAVLEGRGTTSAVLEAASVIRSLQRRPAPTKFCADTSEACTWLAARHPRSLVRDALLEAVEATRAHLDRA